MDCGWCTVSSLYGLLLLQHHHLYCPLFFFFFLAKVTFWQCIFLYLVVGHSGSWTWTCPQIVCVPWRLQHLTKDTFFLQQRTQNTDKTSHLPICIPVKQHTCKPRTTRGWNVPVPHGSEGSHLDTSLMWSVFLQRHLKWTLCDERKKKTTVKWNCTVTVGLPVCSAISAPNYLVT